MGECVREEKKEREREKRINKFHQNYRKERTKKTQLPGYEHSKLAARSRNKKCGLLF